MPTATAPRRRQISGRRLTEMLALMEGSDTVELKLTLPETAIRATATALGMDALDAEIREVVFFDTPELDLAAAGVVVRARRVQGKSGDSVVKLRPVVPGDLPAELRALDAMPGGFVCSGRLKRPADNAQVREATLGRRPLRKIFAKDQRALYREHAPEGIELDDLTPLGPIVVLKLKWVPQDLPRKMVAEAWMYPDGSRIFELSTKCLPAEAFDVAARCRAYLEQHGIELGGAQQAKTRKALEYFARAASAPSA